MCNEGKYFLILLSRCTFKLHKTKKHSEEVKILNNLLIRLTLSNFSSNIDFVLLFDSGYTGDYALHALLFLNLYMVASIEQDGCNYIQSSDHYYILPLQVEQKMEDGKGIIDFILFFRVRV